MHKERLRCFVEHDGAQWQAYCVDVDLAATGATREQARAALDDVLERFCHEHEANTVGWAAQPDALRWLKYESARWLGHPARGYARECYDFRSPPDVVMGLS